MPNYQQVAQLIWKREPFKHSQSMSAKWDGDIYRVFSYRTEVANWSQDTGWWITTERYSTTTSRQVNLIRKVTA